MTRPLPILAILLSTAVLGMAADRIPINVANETGTTVRITLLSPTGGYKSDDFTNLTDTDGYIRFAGKRVTFMNLQQMPSIEDSLKKVNEMLLDNTVKGDNALSGMIQTDKYGGFNQILMVTGAEDVPPTIVRYTRTGGTCAMNTLFTSPGAFGFKLSEGTSAKKGDKFKTQYLAIRKAEPQ